MRPSPRAFIFDIDGTLVDSNELHVDAWDRSLRHFGKQFSCEALRAQIGKGSDQYLPEFLTPEEIKRFGKELDQYRSQLFRKEYLPRVRPFPKVRELFQRIRDDDKRIVLASSGKDEDTKYYIEDLLKIDNLVEGYTCADDADRSKPAPDIFTAALDKLGDVSHNDAITVGGHALRHRSRGQSRVGDNRPPLRRYRRRCFTQNRRHRHLPRPSRCSRPLRQAS